MKQCLADINTLLPMLVLGHPHRKPALDWWSRQPAGRVGLCRFVQLGIVRLLTNPRIMSAKAISARAGWDLTAELLADERLVFWPEPDGFEHHYPKLLRYAVPTPGVVSDAYLAAFALARRAAIATFDRGFDQYEGLEVERIGS